MPAIRPPLLAVSGAAISVACVLVMAGTAVTVDRPGPLPATPAPAAPATTPTHPVATTPAVATSTR